MAARKKNKTQTFHASMIVTRVEDWCVEAADLDEARALLQAGEGHRCASGELVWIELGQLRTDGNAA